MKTLTPYQKNIIATYASNGWNDGMMTGAHHAEIAKDNVRMYADAIKANVQTEAKAAYLKAYQKARKECEKSLGANMAFSF